jgi:hypothetical protein
MARLAGGPQQGLDLGFGETSGAQPFLHAHELDVAGHIQLDVTFLPRPAKQLFERLDLAVDGGGFQSFDAEQMLPVVDELDRSQAPQ